MFFLLGSVLLLLFLGLGLGQGGGRVDVYDNGGGGFGGIVSTEQKDKSQADNVTSLGILEEDVVMSSITVISGLTSFGA